MRAQTIKVGLHRAATATRTYLTTRWWMPLVLYCIALGGVAIAIIQVLKWTGVAD
jgi:hypothetical protein